MMKQKKKYLLPLMCLMLISCSFVDAQVGRKVSRFQKGEFISDNVIRGDVKYADLRDIYLSLPFSEGTRFEMARYLIENKIVPRKNNTILEVKGDGATSNIIIMKAENNMFIVEVLERELLSKSVYTMKYEDGKWIIVDVLLK